MRLKSTQSLAVPSGFLTVTVGEAQGLVDGLIYCFSSNQSISVLMLSLKAAGVL